MAGKEETIPVSAYSPDLMHLRLTTDSPALITTEYFRNKEKWENTSLHRIVVTLIMNLSYIMVNTFLKHNIYIAFDTQHNILESL